LAGSGRQAPPSPGLANKAALPLFWAAVDRFGSNLKRYSSQILQLVTP